MPELPEVETTRRSISPYLQGRTIERVVVRQPKLRWTVPENINQLVAGQKIILVRRRAKYLLIDMANGSLISHLGMSGSWGVLSQTQPAGKHQHIDIELDSGWILRYTDPRRFGCLLWAYEPLQHPLLVKLGPEPLSEKFCADYLFHKTQGRKTAIKLFIMDNAVVVGVGNIYANEALFAAGIDPRIAAGSISLEKYCILVEKIKQILAQAIQQGGTTLKDFVNAVGEPGYFQQQLFVYGRSGLPCLSCKATLQGVRQGQRATVFCPHCQQGNQ